MIAGCFEWGLRSNAFLQRDRCNSLRWDLDLDAADIAAIALDEVAKIAAIPAWNHDLQRSAVQLLAADYSRQESYSDAFSRRLTAPSHSSSPPRLESPAL
jgi:hypothetical protein